MKSLTLRFSRFFFSELSSHVKSLCFFYLSLFKTSWICKCSWCMSVCKIKKPLNYGNSSHAFFGTSLPTRAHFRSIFGRAIKLIKRVNNRYNFFFLVFTLFCVCVFVFCSVAMHRNPWLMNNMFGWWRDEKELFLFIFCSIQKENKKSKKGSTILSYAVRQSVFVFFWTRFGLHNNRNL